MKDHAHCQIKCLLLQLRAIRQMSRAQVSTLINYMPRFKFCTCKSCNWCSKCNKSNKCSHYNKCISNVTAATCAIQMQQI